MRRFALISALASLSLWAFACGGDDDDDNTGTPDAPPIVIPDAAQSTPDSAGGTPDAAMTYTSADLGKTCNGSTPCTDPAVCITLVSGATNGFCTIPCTETPDSCANGWPTGIDGVPMCILSDSQSGLTYCGVACGTGTTPASNGPCPYDLACSLDGNNNTGDGNEICGNS